jgi:two-component system, sensor histidine kinase
MRPRCALPYTLAMQHGRCNPSAQFPTHLIAQMLTSELVRSVLDSAPDAMIIIDSKGSILFANTQVSALFGYPASELLGAPVETLMPQKFRARHAGHRENFSQNERLRPMGIGLELFGVRKDGSEFPVEISLSPIRQETELMVAAAIRDVSERKRAERSLEEARRDAERANLAKSRFLATASHDLRQPLQTLGLLNGALRRMLRDEECQELLREQDLAIDAMSRLLNGLLDISKLESGAVKPELGDFDIAPLFDELRRDFANLAANKGLRLSIDAPRGHAHSDATLVSQVLRNLLSNAIKYTHHGSIELRCEQRGGKLRIEVRDTGVGIAPDQLGLIFDEFYQIGVSPHSSRNGYGLGLSIVQRIARLLDMKLDLGSIPGQGSVFAIELPAVTAPLVPASPAVQPGPTGGAMTPRHILLVEDEPGVRNAMRTLLKVEGFRVTATAGAEEALSRLEDESFDLLVTDYHLENGRTGTQVISAARAKCGAGFKAILVTGDTSAAIREIQGDVNLRITSKPINSDELLAQVRALLAG